METSIFDRMGDEISNTRIEINLDLTKPMTILVQKVCAAIGMVCEPHLMRSKAKAEADVRKIEALSKLQIADISRRAIQRVVTEETNKQINIESILSKALPDVREDARPQNMEDDWIAHFFDSCRLVTDDQMQALWAKVLAGEANTPGRYSKRTVNFLTTLDKCDAVLFYRLCRFIWEINSAKELLVFSGNRDGLVLDSIYTDNGASSEVLKHLEDIGLVSILPNETNVYPFSLTVFPVSCEYHGRKFKVFLKPNQNNRLYPGNVRLTKVGEQIATLCKTEPVGNFFEYVYGRWNKWFKVELAQ